MIILSTIKASSQGETLINCPNCGSKPIKADAPPPHHQKLICSQCDRFIRWLPSPKWDAKFIESLWLNCCRADLEDKLIKLSPRQAEQLKRIEDEFSS